MYLLRSLNIYYSPYHKNFTLSDTTFVNSRYHSTCSVDFTQRSNQDLVGISNKEFHKGDEEREEGEENIETKFLQSKGVRGGTED